MAAPVRADIVHLTGGGYLRGEVTGYADAEFQMKMTGEVVSNISASVVRGVDFEHGFVRATLETKTPPSVTGKLWLLDKQRFNIEGADGTTLHIPFASVISASFNYVADPAKLRPVVKQTPVAEPLHDEVKRPASEPDIAVLTRGERVNILQQLAHGKVTIVEFYATWCAPCRELAPVLERIAQEDADVAIRKVDIVRWGSPVADQYNITAVPRLQIYGADGTLVRTLAGFHESELREAIDRAKASLR